ncbi:diacylglycerol/lipid kinase family protein [Actinomycetospora straminea]|uniref:Diacylglycerol kinase family protein n=1 Tax=Actinomycetospora straminea TaxID=663607 RepID=A0ABP9F1R1_9PSEU|nr:diacylglycerol kinase family protein [Actinomycetospora straminea]MDD7931469.1 diacylglycerol kinase family protein [Actinomycetospora straminea]
MTSSRGGRGGPAGPLRVAPPTHPFLVMNPRSGAGKVRRFGLAEKAASLGASVLFLDEDERELAARLHAAVDDGADLLGVAGGDGTLAPVAEVAAERGVLFLVIPAGTRNHFALDLGLDRSRPDRALDALSDGVVSVVDLGVVGARPFVNNVSLGAYAEIVGRPDYRDSKLMVALDVLPDVLSGRVEQCFTVRAGPMTVTDPTVALVSNNPYGARGAGGVARRRRLDLGVLGLMCVDVGRPGEALAAGERQHPPAIVATAEEVVIDAPSPVVRAAVDGESTWLDTPAVCRIRPRSLRVLIPRHRPRAAGHRAAAAPRPVGRATAR